MKPKVDIGNFLFDDPPGVITRSRYAQVFGPGRDQVFIRTGANKAKAIGPAAQKDDNKDWITRHVAPIAEENQGKWQQRR